MPSPLQPSRKSASKMKASAAQLPDNQTTALPAYCTPHHTPSPTSLTHGDDHNDGDRSRSPIAIVDPFGSICSQQGAQQSHKAAGGPSRLSSALSWADQEAELAVVNAIELDDKVGRNRPHGNAHSPTNGQLSLGHSLQWRRGQVLGAGSFGVVTLGMVPATGELIAVKQIDMSVMPAHERTEDASRIMTEIDFLRSLSHPNIVTYRGMDMEGDEGIIYVYMEYVPGGSVAQLLKQFGRFDEDTVRTFVAQILHGLEYLHGRGIVHRDIKGANVLVSDKGEVKIADLGSSALRSTAIGGFMPVGTIEFMAPEVVQGTACPDTAPASDVWSLGCTTLEMLTAEKPWADLGIDNPIGLYFHIATSADTTPTLPSHVSADCIGFLRQCLKRDAKERSTVKDLLRHPWLNANPSTHMDDARALLSLGPRQRSDVLPLLAAMFPSKETSSTELDSSFFEKFSQYLESVVVNTLQESQFEHFPAAPVRVARPHTAPSHCTQTSELLDVQPSSFVKQIHRRVIANHNLEFRSHTPTSPESLCTDSHSSIEEGTLLSDFADDKTTNEQHDFDVVDSVLEKLSTAVALLNDLQHISTNQLMSQFQPANHFVATMEADLQTQDLVRAVNAARDAVMGAVGMLDRRYENDEHEGTHIPAATTAATSSALDAAQRTPHFAAILHSIDHTSSPLPFPASGKNGGPEHQIFAARCLPFGSSKVLSLPPLNPNTSMGASLSLVPSALSSVEPTLSSGSHTHQPPATVGPPSASLRTTTATTTIGAHSPAEVAGISPPTIRSSPLGFSHANNNDKLLSRASCVCLPALTIWNDWNACDVSACPSPPPTHGDISPSNKPFSPALSPLAPIVPSSPSPVDALAQSQQWSRPCSPLARGVSFRTQQLTLTTSPSPTPPPPPSPFRRPLPHKTNSSMSGAVGAGPSQSHAIGDAGVVLRVPRAPFVELVSLSPPNIPTTPPIASSTSSYFASQHDWRSREKPITTTVAAESLLTVTRSQKLPRLSSL